MMIRATLACAGILFVAAPLIAQERSDSASFSQAAVTAEMVAAADALLATMDSEARRQRMLGISKSEFLQMSLQDDARKDWSYWPRPRSGLSIELMTPDQRTLTHDLLATLLSAEGHMKVVHIMQLEEILWSMEDVGLPRGVEKYFLSFFGTPTLTAPWAWRFEGHHVSLSVTVAPDHVTVTPSFFGADPAETLMGPLAGFRPLRDEEDLARDLVLSLSESQRARAVISAEAPNDIFATNANKDQSAWETWRSALQPEGLSISDMDDSQRVLVRRLVDEVISRYRPEISDAYLQSIDLDELTFAWMGSVERRAQYYYRLQGGDFMFELDNAQDNGNHIHSVWRNPTDDFGDDLLADHYRLSHR
jgi:hypothetical protein